MIIKNGPQFNPFGLRPEMVSAQPIVVNVFDNHGLPMVMWTSGVDRTHSISSLHYVGAAVDVWWDDGNWDPFEKPKVGRDLREQLGSHYDVVEEPQHIHIEYQPKKGVNL